MPGTAETHTAPPPAEMMLRSVALLMLSSAAAVGGAEKSGGENGGNPFASDISEASPEFICEYRKLAWEYAKKIQPSHDARLTFDALMLGRVCNQSRPERATDAPAPLAAAAACSMFVAIGGDDSHAGSSAATAKKTVAAGIEATRKLSGAKTLCVGAGTFYLEAPLDILAADSGLTIQGVPNATWLSGARKLPALKWEKFKVAPAKSGVLSELMDTNVPTPGNIRIAKSLNLSLFPSSFSFCDIYVSAGAGTGGMLGRRPIPDCNRGLWLLQRLTHCRELQGTLRDDGAGEVQELRLVSESWGRPQRVEREMLHPRGRQVGPQHKLNREGSRQRPLGGLSASRQRLEGLAAGWLEAAGGAAPPRGRRTFNTCSLPERQSRA